MKPILRGFLFTTVLGGSMMYASPITYTFAGTVSGTVGSTPFTNKALTVSVSGDTSSVVFLGGSSAQYQFAYGANAATFSIAGVGSGTLSHSGSINNNQAVFSGSINLYDNGAGLLITIEDDLIAQSTFASYALATPIGPSASQSTDPSLPDWVNVTTSLGNMTVTSGSGFSFQAVASAPTTPIPSSFYLLMTALVCLTFYMAARGRRPMFARKIG